MVVSCLRMAREDADRGELKLVNSALKELRYSFRVFEPYVGIRKVSLFGSARIKEEDLEYEVARDMGRLMADAGLDGHHRRRARASCRPGVEGAGLDRSFGVGIQLPFESVAPMFVEDPKLINFRYFFTRKLTFMKESHGFVLLPGGFGTMDEAFELLTLQQTGRMPLVPTVLLDPPGSSYWESWRHFVEHELVGRGLVSPHDLELIRITDSVEEARDELCGFYEVFHSTRYVGKRLIIRTHRPVSDEVLARLNTEFEDILVAGGIERVDADRARAGQRRPRRPTPPGPALRQAQPGPPAGHDRRDQRPALIDRRGGRRHSASSGDWPAMAWTSMVPRASGRASVVKVRKPGSSKVRSACSRRAAARSPRAARRPRSGRR